MYWLCTVYHNDDIIIDDCVAVFYAFVYIVSYYALRFHDIDLRHMNFSSECVGKHRIVFSI